MLITIKQLKLFYVLKANYTSFFSSCCASAPSSDHGLSFHETSKTHTDTTYAVVLPQTGDQALRTLTTHNTHKGQTSMLSVGFYLVIPSTKQLLEQHNNAQDNKNKLAISIITSECMKRNNFTFHSLCSVLGDIKCFLSLTNHLPK